MEASWSPETQAINPKYDLSALFAEYSNDSHVVYGREIHRGTLLQKRERGVTLQETKLVSLNCALTSFENLHAIDSEFIDSDFTESQFAGGYFRNVGFMGCCFRKVRFDGTVFDSCRFIQSGDISLSSELVFHRCVFLSSSAETERLLQRVGAIFEECLYFGPANSILPEKPREASQDRPTGPGTDSEPASIRPNAGGVKPPPTDGPQPSPPEGRFSQLER